MDMMCSSLSSFQLSEYKRKKLDNSIPQYSNYFYAFAGIVFWNNSNTKEKKIVVKENYIKLVYHLEGKVY